MIQKLSAFCKNDPGLAISGGAHALAFLLLIVNFSWWHDKPLENVESVPVEMVTTSELNQIMNGEKTAKQMDVAQRVTDKVAEVEDHKPAPPIENSVKDTPPPPSPEKANSDPGQADKTEEANAPPPPAPPEKPQPVAPPPPPAAAVPTPPEKPVEKTEAPTPPEKPDDVKAPEEAEAIEKKPPPKPKVEKPKKVAKPKKVPVPKARPVEVAEAKEVPDPPRKPEPEKPSLKQRTLDQVASLLDRLKPPKEEKKQKSGNETKEEKHSDFSLDKISALLDHDTPQRRASTGRKLAKVASLGSPTAHAEKMSPSLMAQIDGWLIDHYRGCWSYFGLGATTGYVPKVHVQMAIDGSLTARPKLENAPSDPNLRSLADSAVRAVDKCNPMPIPAWFKPHYEAWRDRVVRFDPKEMS